MRSYATAYNLTTFNKETKQTAVIKKTNESEAILFIKCNTKGIKTFSFYDSCLKMFSDL
jgi:hypothetical protein